MKYVTGIIVLLFLAACTGDTSIDPAAPVAAPETARTTAQGEVVGFVAENGAQAWLGLPFAATTAGENRWRAPRPAPSWQGVREAIAFGERCTQMTNRLNEGEGIEPHLVIGSDDCLTLNIFAPGDAEAENLPVMVWIHGGANVWGRAASYDGSRLAVNEDVIIVTIQYRLGPLGWFAHEAIRASAEVPGDAGANFGILDQIAALNWVRDNIGGFGGDPANVTIFGESAGGHNVAALLASPMAEGLFHRAIIQSGSFDSVALAEAEGSEGGDPYSGQNIAAKFGAQTAADLRAVPVADLLEAYWVEGGGFIEGPRIIEDGIVLPEGPMRNAFASTDSFNNVPIITGTNRDEMKFFYVADERLVRRLFGIILLIRDTEFYNALSEYTARVWRVRSVDLPAQMMAEAGHDQVYAYRFDWDEEGSFLFSDFSKLFGAAHALEIPFVFNRFRLMGDADRVVFSEKTSESREHLSRAMGGYWASFARTGVPVYEGEPGWPTYTGDGEARLLRFDSKNDGGIELMTGADDLAALVADLDADERLNQAETCLVAYAISEWRVDLEKEARLPDGCE